jgi:hypothetical protein
MLLALTVAISAQTDQQMSGTILDNSGAVLPGAEITVVHLGTGATRTTTANSSGNYVITSLPIGAYTIVATAPGFKTYEAQNVQLNVGARLNLNITLELGNIAETVSVEAGALMVESGSAEVGHVISGLEATQVQLNGRNFVQLVSLLPGVSTTYTSSFRLFGPFGVIGAAQSVNGTRPDAATFLVNGVDNKDPGGPSSNNYVNVTPDAVAEFKTVTASQSAQYGLNAGATITMALKSGTKQFHGSAYEYLRHDSLQSLSFQATTKPPLKYNNFGWSLGGPLNLPKAKDKLFFFAAQDFKRRRVSDVVTFSVPTLAQRAGDFSALPPAQWPRDPLTGQPFADGRIPADRLNATGVKLVNLYPRPNGTFSGGNYAFLDKSVIDVNEYIIKGDYNISANNQIAVHLIHDGNKSLRGTQNAVLFDTIIPGNNAGLQWTSVLGANTVNTFVVGFGGNAIRQKTGIRPNPELGFSTTVASSFGLNYPRLFNVNSDIPTVQITGFTTLSVTPLNFTNYTHTYSFRDDLSRIIGNHTVKTGIIVQRGRKNQDNIPAINGTFAFSPAGRPGTTNNALGDALLGLYNTYTEGGVITHAWPRYWNIEPYLQDDWKLNQRTTVNLGLRYSYVQPSYLALQNGSTFMPQFYDPTRAPDISASNGAITSVPGAYDPYNGLVLPGDGFPDAAKGIVPDAILNDAAVQRLFRGVPQGFVETDYGTLSPRLGIAYDLTGRQNTVLRGGFAITYERIRTTAPNATTTQPPFSNTVQVRNGGVDNPGGGTTILFPSAINRSFDTTLKTPRYMNWTFGVQQSVGTGALLDVGYVASIGRNLTWLKNINQLPEGIQQANPGINANALRPYKGYTDILVMANGGVSDYHSLQTQFQKRFATSGFFRTAYTWSRNLSDSIDPFYTPMDSYDLHKDYGPAYFNKPHVLSISYSYPLPFWRDGVQWYEKAFGAWTINGVTTYSSGWPLNVVVSGDIAGVGSNPVSGVTIDGSGVGGFVQRADLVGDPYANTSGTQFLNPAAFAVPAAGKFGNAPPYGFRGPMIQNWDLTFDKSFALTGSHRLNVRAEVFNIFNHLSYVRVQNVLNQANFGQVIGATDPRIAELVFRYTF